MSSSRGRNCPVRRCSRARRDLQAFSGYRALLNMPATPPHPLQRFKLAGTEYGIAQLAKPDGDVGALGDQILPLIGNRHLDPQQRVRGEKFWQPGNDFASSV